MMAGVKPNERVVEVFRLYSKQNWFEIKFDDLKHGDIFRMFEPDTKYPVEDEKGNHQFVAQSDARRNGELYLIDCMPLIPIKDKDK